MKLLSYTQDKLTILLKGKEYGILTHIGICSWLSGIYAFNHLTGETATSIKALIKEIRRSEKKTYNIDIPNDIIYEIQLAKRDLWLIKHAIFFVQEDSLERIEFSTITGIRWEEAKVFLTEVNSILKDCGFNEETYRQFTYPIPLEEQVDLGHAYVYFFLERTQVNIEIFFSLLNRDDITFDMHNLLDLSIEEYLDYTSFLNRYQESDQYIFILSSGFAGIRQYIFIYPETIVFASYQKPWETTLVPESDRLKQFEMFEILSKKAERIIMGFKEDETIYSVRIAPTVDEFIKMGQKFPTLERQSLDADFEIKNLKPDNEKSVNALKMLQFCAKNFLPFM